MGHTDIILQDVRRQCDAHPQALAEARARTALVRSSAMSVTYGALRHYASGSLAHHTQNHPISDGDAGIVLNRVNYPALGPDGRGEAPDNVVEELCQMLGSKIRETYPKAHCGTSKRGPKIWFGSPIDGQDPTVDIVVALTRKDASGLWIPNLDKGTWEPSDPEKHATLLNAAPTSLCCIRRKVIRLLKAWNKQFSDPMISSFHLSVLALEFVKPGCSVAAALLEVFEQTSARMDKRQSTKDPAGVSANLRLLGSWDAAERRTRLAARDLREALEHDRDLTDSASKAALAKTFHTYLPQFDNLAATIGLLRPRTPVSTSGLGLGASALVRPTRAYGADAPPRSSSW